MKKLLLFFISIFLLSSCQSTRVHLHSLGVRYKTKYNVSGYMRKIEFERELTIDKDKNEFIYYYGVCDTSIELPDEYKYCTISYNYTPYNTSDDNASARYTTKDFVIYDSERKNIEIIDEVCFAFKYNSFIYVSYSHFPTYVIEEIESNDFRNTICVNDWFYMLVTK